MFVLSGAAVLQPVDFALNRRPFPFPPEPLQRPDAFADIEAGGALSAAMLVTSWAFTVLRRCRSAEGRCSA